MGAVIPLLRFFMASNALHHAAVAGDSHDGLGGQIDIAVQMAGKVIRAKLLARILAKFIQITHPLAQHIHVRLRQIVARAEVDRRPHHSHLASRGRQDSTSLGDAPKEMADSSMISMLPHSSTGI